MNKGTFAFGLIASAVLAAPAVAQMPKLQPDESYVSISGTVVNSDDDEFTLDYGQGQISVEMDDWEWQNEDMEVLPGDEVTVYGRVEKHLFVDASIEADSVFIEDPATYYYSPTPEVTTFTVMDVSPVTPVIAGNLVFTGTVTNVKDRTFTINTGDLELTVNTSGMRNNPLDDEGRQKVETGDTVSVVGNLGTGVIGDRRLEADSIVILQESNKQNQQQQSQQQQQQQQNAAKQSG